MSVMGLEGKSSALLRLLSPSCDLDISNQLRRIAAVTVRGSFMLQFPLQGWLDDVDDIDVETPENPTE